MKADVVRFRKVCPWRILGMAFGAWVFYREAMRTSNMAREIIREIKAVASEERAAGATRFFKTGPGQYGYGDKFLGVATPELRRLARRYRDEVSWEGLGELLGSPWHEVRAFALVVLVEWSRRREIAEEARRELADFYLAHVGAVNNWDLVDISAPWVLGPVLCEEAETVVPGAGASGGGRLWGLARSGELWQERISLLTAFWDIRRGRFAHTLALAEHFLSHRHDLMHKAAGWMLREVGKRDEAVLLAFLDVHATRMPRTMFRYAIERL
jgi:3-methyladenine DNA glycosylase AlkD